VKASDDNVNVGFGDSWLGTRGLASLSCAKGFKNKEKLRGREALSEGTRDTCTSGQVGAA